MTDRRTDENCINSLTITSVRSANNTLQTMLKHAYFMTVIDGVFCVGRACDKLIRDAFQSSHLRLWQTRQRHCAKT